MPFCTQRNLYITERQPTSISIKKSSLITDAIHIYETVPLMNAMGPNEIQFSESYEVIKVPNEVGVPWVVATDGRT